MLLSEIPSGASVFVDANVFIYALSQDPTYGVSSLQFLERIEHGDVRGFVSTSVLNEVLHRLMTLEACQTFGWPYAGIVHRLRTHIAEVKQLTKYRQALIEIEDAGFQISSIHLQHTKRATEICQLHGLLTNDAVLVAVMEDLRLTHLASNDSDFDRVENILRYSPAE